MRKSEMLETLHANNKELLDRFSEIENKMDTKIDTLRAELRIDRRWLIGLFMTAIVAVPALLKILGHV